MAEGMVTKIEVDQDTTALPLELLKLAAAAIPGGVPTRRDAGAGKVSPQADFYEVTCDGEKLSIKPITSFAVQAVAGGAPEVPPEAAGDDPNGPKGTKLPK